MFARRPRVLLFCLATVAISSACFAAEVSLSTGKGLLEHKKYDEALAIFKAAASEDSPGACEAKFLVAYTYDQSQDYPKAIESYKKFIASCADSDEGVKQAKIRLAVCYRETRDFENAISINKALIQQDPNSAGVRWREIAMCYRDSGKINDAVSSLNSGLEAATVTKDGSALHDLKVDLATAYRQMGALSEAVSMNESLAKEYPDEASLRLFEVGMWYAEAGNLDKATEVLKDIASKYPDNPRATFQVYVLLFRQGKREEAERRLNEIMVLKPAWTAEALYWKAHSLSWYARDESAAISVLQTLVREHPIRGSAADAVVIESMGVLASTLESEGRFVEAEGVVDKLLALPSNRSPEARARLNAWAGRLCAQGTRYREAIDRYIYVVRDQGTGSEAKATAMYEIAMCSAKLGETRRAQQYLWRVTREFSGTECAKKARGQLYLWGQLRREGGVQDRRNEGSNIEQAQE